ncbi:tripartite tricarboxylate transporter substrate binding protein [Variovorax terrae]|uniref:Tripartite tricarboxylate transporter substrate binding protein n=1 Tax=Variovorax terrae TaxID=2923278 RepID=A0A9X1VZE5_9BURK|nr:tripartite tricarboxylate transporter substrate binding protein [Variovorax terrae]MCJ0766150.1 tripartite tricarboxylate transporter substrate binding protein [Variovorax terrae]
MKRRTFLGSSAALLPLAAAAQGADTLSIVVPFPAGGVSDVFARILAPRLGRQLGKTTIVENVTGASGSLAANKVLKRADQGDTLFLASPTELILAPATLAAIKYKPSDFRVVALISRTPLALYVRGDLPARSIDEFVAFAKTRSLTYGSVGIGSIYHLATEGLREAAGLQLTHVPYRGGMPMLQDLQGGLVDLALFPADGNLAKMVAGGRMRAIGVTGAARVPAFPDVPTFAESRSLATFSTVDAWGSVALPAATPDRLVRAVHTAATTVLSDIDVRKQLEAAAGGPLAPLLNLEQLAAFYAAEVAKFTTAVRRAKLDSA